MPSNIDQETFANQYRPDVTQEDFANKFRPDESSGVNQWNIDAYTNMAPPDVDKMVSNIHQAYVQKGPFTGSVSDQLFNQGPIGRIMSAFGQNFKDSWDGSGESNYQIELEKEAKEHDVNLLTAIRNAVNKPAAAALDFISKAPYAAMAGVSGAVEQSAEELNKTGQVFYNDPNSAILGKALGYPLLAGAEILSGYAHGAGMEGGIEDPIHQVDHVQQILEARSKGQVGEGEAGFFKVKEPSPEDIEARQNAAHLAGIDMSPPEEAPKFVPTVDELAAQMDPDTFNKLNHLTDVQENLRSSRDSLMAQVKDSTDPQYLYKDQQRIKSQLEDIPTRLQEIDEQLRDLIPDVNSARERSEELLNSQSPEGDAYRNLVQAQAFEKALAAQPVKAKAEETLRLANDLKEVSQPDAKPGTTGTDTKTNPQATDTSPAGTSKTTITKTKKQPEVKLSPEAVSGMSTLKKVQGTGEKTPLSLNQRLEIDSVLKGWKSEVGEVPQEEALKTEQQLTEAQRLADDSLPTATRVAMGDAEVPEGYNVHPEAVLRILKKRAEDTGDVALGLKLADTRLAGEARTMGQRLNLLRGIYDIDPVGIIQDLNNSWKDVASKKIADTVKDIKKEVDDAMATFAPDLKAFAESIKCDY